MGHYNSFLIRIWTDNGQNLVRGYIQHVGTEEVVHFMDWNKMVDFMTDHLDWHIIENRTADKQEQPALGFDGDE